MPELLLCPGLALSTPRARFAAVSAAVAFVLRHTTGQQTKEWISGIPAFQMKLILARRELGKPLAVRVRQHIPTHARIDVGPFRVQEVPIRQLVQRRRQALLAPKAADGARHHVAGARHSMYLAFLERGMKLSCRGSGYVGCRIHSQLSDAD